MLKKLTRALFRRPASRSTPRDHKSDPSSDNGNSALHERASRSVGDELDLSGAVIYEREDHCVTRRDISPNALKVLYRLNDAGYQAFLVGGGVRDLLLGGHPKDFDISTNATPEDIRQLFRNARIIGRRFKIVHLSFGREIIEVTTFRAHHAAENEFDDDDSRQGIRGLDSAHSSTGMILRDNVYGNINEDALRRDFTVNALYYTTNRFRIIDFAHGMDDLDDGLIRIIGDPETRYREDPVRMLRAVRFSAKLNFDIEERTREPLDRLAHLLAPISPARLFDESLKLLVGGHAEVTFEVLRQFRVAQYLFKATLDATQDPDSPGSRLLVLALRNTDLRIEQGKSVTPAFLFAALLWPPLQARLSAAGFPENSPLPDLQEAAGSVIMEQLQRTAIPRRFTTAMREIWELQLRLRPRSRRGVETMLAHPRFRAAYDFLLLREEAGENLDGLGQWWTDFQHGDRARQEELLSSLDKKSPRKTRRRKPRRQDNSV
jgi:poly(A) polymerase